MKREAVEEILRLTAPEPPQQDNEFTVIEWRGLMKAEGNLIIQESAARQRLMAAVERGELTTRMTSNDKGRVRVFSVVQE